MTATIRQGVRWLGWYLREVSGDSAYDRYVEHTLADHPDREVLSRRQFERQRLDDRNARPQSRCC